MKKNFIFLCFPFIIFSQVSAFDSGKLVWIQVAVYDEAKILSQNDTISIKQKIEDIRKKYTAEILVVIIPTTDGQDIGQLWVEIGQKVGVGKKDVSNGVVILVAVNDRAWNISTWYGVEWALPDLITKRIGENNFPDNFRNGNYGEWISWALMDIDGYLSKDPWVVSKLSETIDTQLQPQLIFWYFIISVFVSGFLFRSDLIAGDMKSFFKKLLIVYIVTLPISYFLLWVTAIIFNFFIWLFASLFSTGNLNSRSWGGGWWGGSSWSWGGGGFWWGGFGGGGSSGKW